MAKPTKKELIQLLGKVQKKLNEHQKTDSKIMAGYTLAVNVEMVDISNEITDVLTKYL